MIRVLHVVHALTRGGGLANVVMNYYRFVDRTKVQFDFLYFVDVENNFIDEITEMGGRCYKLNSPDLSRKSHKERESFFKEHEGEWQILHCHALFAVSVFSKVAKKHGCKYVVAHSHSTNYGNGLLKKARNFLFIKQAKYLSDGHIACSEMAGDFMFGKSGYLFLKNAVNVEKFKFNKENRIEMRKALGAEDKFIIGHVGGLTKQKNQRKLIELVAALKDKIPNILLLLVGGDGIASGSTRLELEQLISELNLENEVRLLGPRKDVDVLLSAFDLYAMPSWYEGFPVSCVEAQVNGLPCVFSDNITSEVNVYDVVFVSLEDDERWRKEILDKFARTEEYLSRRNDGVNIMRENGYDIVLESQRLCDFYMDALTRKA